MLALNPEFGKYELFFDGMEEALKRVAECGISHVHWVYDWEEDYIYSIHEMKYIKSLFDKYGLKAKSLHATEGGKRGKVVDGKKVFFNREILYDLRKDYTSANEFMRLAGVELIKNRLDLAKMLGADDIVLHMQLPYEALEASKEAKETYWKQSFKSFDELQDYCKEIGMKIAVENMICTPKEHQFEQFDKLFERYSFDFLGFCFDSGHGALMCDNPNEFAERYQDRLIALHLHDNDGLIREKDEDYDLAVLMSDCHRIPFNGIIDWDALSKVIADSPYELPINLELVSHPNPTDEEQREFLADALKAGNKITEMINNYRK